MPGRKKQIYDVKVKTDLEKLKYKLKISLSRMGLKDTLMNDAVNDIVLNIIEGKSKKQTFDQMAMDWLRKNLGHKTRGKLKHEAVRNMVNNYKMIAQLPDKESGGLSKDEKFILAEIISFLKCRKTKAVLRLHAFWGLSHLEIGVLFDYSEAYISKLIDNATKELRVKMRKSA